MGCGLGTARKERSWSYAIITHIRGNGHEPKINRQVSRDLPGSNEHLNESVQFADRGASVAHSSIEGDGIALINDGGERE